MLATIIYTLFFIFSLALIAAILLQSGNSAGLSGAIAGGAESIFGKKKGMDDFLVKLTSLLAAGFLIIGAMISVLE